MCSPETPPVNRPGIAGGHLVQVAQPWVCRPARRSRVLLLSRWDIADGFEQAPVVEPVDPFKRGIFHRLEGSPWSSPMDHLGLVKAIDRLGQTIVIAIADTADRWFDPGSARFSEYLMETYWLPRSLWWTRPPRWTGRLSWIACSRASSTKLACAVLLTRKPTI